MCKFCVVRQKRKRYREELRPIVSRVTMERVQVDLIDMQSRPDGVYKWIMVTTDHFSRY